MKKRMAACATVLALSTVLSMTASAASIITGDSFTSTSKVKDKWVVDQYAPEEFDRSGGELYLVVGKSGYYASRPSDKKDKKYANQGMKLPVEKPSSNTWTATVKFYIDSAWLSSTSESKKVEFRVDLMDGSGNAIGTAPALSLMKAGRDKPVFTFVNPKSKPSGRGIATYYINGDKDKEFLEIEEGWVTLFIRSSKGKISYYLDEKKLGDCTLDQTDIFPTHMALNMYNYERSDVSRWDNAYLYDGTYAKAQRSSSLTKEREEKLEEQYAKKRAKWEAKYTEYKLSDGHWYTFSGMNKEYKSETGGKSLPTATSLLSKSKYEDFSDVLQEYDRLWITNGTGTTIVDTRIKDDKEMPDSYWDY